MSKEYWQIFIGIGQYWIFKFTFLFQIGKNCNTHNSFDFYLKSILQVREDPDTADLFCQVSQSSNVGPSVSPKRKRPTRRKGDEMLSKLSSTHGLVSVTI